LNFGTNDIAARLYEDIVVGAYPFGNKLVEERLTETYETKRHILREAFGHLEELGFVERIANRGVFVREPDPNEVRELYKLRSLLERHAAREILLPAPKKITDEMRRIQDQHTSAIRDLRFREVLHLNTEFHRVQYSACLNETLVSAIEFYATRTHLITALKFGEPAVMEQVIFQHEDIIEATKGNDHAVLEDRVENHFNMDRVDQYEREYKVRHDGSGTIETRAQPFGARTQLTR